MKVFGLTGGVGMGKSTAANFFCEQNVKVVDTDILARELVQPGQPALEEISELFGKNILAPDGGLRRSEMARIVFSDASAREKLETILHPRIRRLWREKIEIWRRENCWLAIVVIPLLFETRAEIEFDKIICVACAPAVQHQRLSARSWNAVHIEQRIAAQMPVTEKIARSHFVIWTDGALGLHQRQIQRLLQNLNFPIVPSCGDSPASLNDVSYLG
jgi:dephospho-CoA kinase